MNAGVSQNWIQAANAGDIPSPALLVYPDRIEENVRRMVQMAGEVDRLRPHIKTHKLPEILRIQMSHGIRRFKTATIAETEMVASCGAEAVLLAYQPVGPNVARLIELGRRFPGTRFATIADSLTALNALSQSCTAAKIVLDVFLDIDCGMHRTGVPPDERAAELYRSITGLTGLRSAGLHAYDGHIHDADLGARERRCEEGFQPVLELRRNLERQGFAVPKVIAGGTPTFPIHARRDGVECSPGTCVLWDAGYSTKLPDLKFELAAVLLTRVISKPGSKRLCLDLGHKAVASEMPHPRVVFPALPDAQFISHSEEHLVIETEAADSYAVGQVLYGIPWHVCPTVALHNEAVVVKNGRAEARWKVVARQRSLTV